MNLHRGFDLTNAYLTDRDFPSLFRADSESAADLFDTGRERNPFTKRSLDSLPFLKKEELLIAVLFRGTPSSRKNRLHRVCTEQNIRLDEVVSW